MFCDYSPWTTMNASLVFMLRSFRGYFINGFLAACLDFQRLASPFLCPNSLPAEYDYCPESVLLPLRDRLFSLSLNGPRQRATLILPPFPCEQLRAESWGEAAFTVMGLSLSHRAESPDRQGIQGQWPVALAACVCERMTGWMDLWHTVRWQGEGGCMSDSRGCLVWRNAECLL